MSLKASYFNKGRRIPSLDGMRAVAISIVLLAHASGTRNLLYRKQIYQIAGDLGPLGVRIFFVISGFLITSILLREIETTRTLSLGQFYLRRVFRIFPAFYCFLLVILLVQVG